LRCDRSQPLFCSLFLTPFTWLFVGRVKPPQAFLLLSTSTPSNVHKERSWLSEFNGWSYDSYISQPPHPHSLRSFYVTPTRPRPYEITIFLSPSPPSPSLPPTTTSVRLSGRVHRLRHHRRARQLLISLILFSTVAYHYHTRRHRTHAARFVYASSESADLSRRCFPFLLRRSCFRSLPLGRTILCCSRSRSESECRWGALPGCSCTSKTVIEE
jgi:hypothetical protein